MLGLTVDYFFFFFFFKQLLHLDVTGEVTVMLSQTTSPGQLG